MCPGTCRHCGCHGDQCMGRDGERCVWTDPARTVCSGDGCQLAELVRKRTAEARAKQKPARKKYAGWGYGAIVADLRKRARRKRRVA